MKFSEIKKAVVTVAMSNHVPFVRGLHGIGKSEMMMSVAEEISKIKNKDVSFHTVDMAHVKEGELTGMPITSVDKETNCKINEYTIYGLFNDIIKEAKEGIIPVLFLDEINRCDRVVFNEIMPIVLNKRVQEIELPEEMVILTAGNPEDITKYNGATDDYSVLPMDPALKDRFFIFELDVDANEWVKWASKKKSDDTTNINNDIIEFIADRPQMLHFLSTDEINPTPRAWKLFSDCYNMITENNKLSITENSDIEDSIMIIGSSKIGSSTTSNFIRFLRESKNPILKYKDFFGVNDKTFEDNIIKLKNETPIRQSLTINNIEEYFLNKLEEFKKSKRKDKKELVEKFCQILWSLPKDIMLGCIKDLKDVNKNALAAIVENDPKKVIEIQKYLI